ncbi:MAG: nucleotidyl transferase AbiEii/AbiGii toxin family protein [Nitrospira sp.]|nr:nucleotidyl transferase AbiEii/AbiGii toxin family protein [Nitrospira sp.]
MRGPETRLLRHHHDAAFFSEAIAFTSAQQGFVSALIEKDYFCSVVLAYLSGLSDGNLVFKGGTCLTKVHAGFYRLSEDLDFTISMPVDASRAERSRQIEPVKRALRTLYKAMPEFREDEPLRGANSSRQYVGSVSYESPLYRRRETIKIEISLRELLVEQPGQSHAATILRNPLTGEPLVPPIRFACIAKREALAEKFRAALTRREPAVRDYFDVDYAVQHRQLDPTDAAWLRMVKDKLPVPGNEPVDISERRLRLLRDQIGLFLKPVLRVDELRDFDLDRAFGLVAKVAVEAAA